LTSKIINMADKMKDAEDRIFESLFAAEPIADDGFSDHIVKRIRRHIWIQRLTLPAAMLIGGAIAIKPATQLVMAGSRLLGAVPQDILVAPADWIPQLPIVLLGGALLVIGMLSVRMLEE
jgi:hypothetical protein